MDRRTFLTTTAGALTGVLTSGSVAIALPESGSRLYPLFGMPDVPRVGDKVLASFGYDDVHGYYFGGCDTIDREGHPFPLKEFECVAVDERHGRHWATFVFQSPTEFSRFRVRHDGLSDDGGTQIVLDFCEYYAPKEGEFNCSLPPLAGVKGGGTAESFFTLDWR